MNTDVGVRVILKIVFGKEPTPPKKFVRLPSINSNWLNEDFSNKVSIVVGLRKKFVRDRWKGYFDSRNRKMLLSHTHYIISVLYACLYENKCNENKFDKFISVCTLLKLLSDETLEKARVDFSNLNPDIFMVFYENVMKRCFRESEDFFGLVEYIRKHKYAEWILGVIDPTSPDKPLTSASRELLSENMRKELVSYRASDKVSNEQKLSCMDLGVILTSIVLVDSKADRPDLPSESEVLNRLVEYRKKERASKAEKERKDETTILETSHGDAILNSDSKASFGTHQEYVARHESTIEAVIRQNQSKNSGNEIVNKEIHEKASGILESLESKITSLVEVLDECSLE